jgi:hypothetical protein
MFRFINRIILFFFLRPPARFQPEGQDAVALYVLACKIFANFPFELKKVTGNSTGQRTDRTGSWGSVKYLLTEEIKFAGIS